MAKASNVGGMMGLTFEIEGVPQMARVLGVTFAKVKNLTPVWDEIADNFVKGEKRLFSREGTAPGWSQWAAVDKVYAAWKQAAGFGSKILTRTKRLGRSLSNRSDKDFIFKAGKKGMEIGTRVLYAKYHQRGVRGASLGRSGATTGGLAKREPIRISSSQRKQWVHLIQKFLVESGQFERANLGQQGRFSAGKWLGQMGNK